MIIKPIALVRLYRGYPETGNHHDFIRKSIKEELKGYNVLISFNEDYRKDSVMLSVFNGDDITPIQFEELKRIVENDNKQG